MKSLVLGGKGFIGRHLCKLLDNPRVFGGRIEDLRSVSESLKGIDTVFHLVSTTVPFSSNQDMSSDLLDNVFSTLRLLQMCKEEGVSKIIFVSSGGAVYGPSSIPLKESDETNPVCSYGIHKLAIEKYLQLFYHLHGLDYRILRVSNPYGADQDPKKSQGVVAKFIDSALKGKPIEIWGDGSTVRDYVHVDDVARAIVMSEAYSGKHKLFNVGRGKGHTLLELVSIISKSIKVPVEIRFLDARSSDVPVNILNISRAKEEFGWEPLLGLEKSIQSIVKGMNDRA